VDEPRYLDPDEPPATKRPRNGKGRFVALPATAERDAEAARMRARGMRLREIAAALGFGSEGAAHDAADRAMAAVRASGGDIAKRSALARLDEMYARALAVLDATHYTVSQGRLIYIGGTPVKDDGGKVVWVGGEPLLDDAPVLNALRVMLAIEERRAKLEGTDAPAKSRVEVTQADGVDTALRRLLDEMDRRDPSRSPGGDPRLA